MLVSAFKNVVRSPAEAYGGGLLPDNRRRIGLLVGNDVSALMLINRLVPKLIKAGYKPVLFMAEHRPSTKDDAKQLPLQSLAFYERYLTNNVIFPLVESIPALTGPNDQAREDILYSPRQLLEVYGIDLDYVDDINSPEFVERIRSETNMPILTSIRCYQIAHTDLISAQKDKVIKLTSGEEIKGAFWNMHPGKLPEYQGIFGPLYAMNNLQRTYAWTLHDLIYDPDDSHKGIDKGDVITQTTSPIDYSKPALEQYTSFARRAADMIYDRAEDYFRGEVPITPQSQFKGDEVKEKYHTHPTSNFFESDQKWPTVLARLVEHGAAEGFYVDPKIKAKVQKGITEPHIVDCDEISEAFPKMFVAQGDMYYEPLHIAIERAVLDWEVLREDYFRAHSEQHPDSPFGVVDAMLVSGKQLPNGFRLPSQPVPAVGDSTMG